MVCIRFCLHLFVVSHSVAFYGQLIRIECVFLINLAQRSQGDEFKCLSIYVEVVFYVLHIFLFYIFAFCFDFLIRRWGFTFCFFFRYFILPLYYRDRYTNSSSFPTESLNRCMWMNELNSSRAVATAKEPNKTQWISKLNWNSTEKYFVRLNGGQGVAVSKKQMNVCKCCGKIYFIRSMSRKIKSNIHETNGNKLTAISLSFSLARSTQMCRRTASSMHIKSVQPKWNHNLCINSELNDNKCFRRI